MTPIPLRDAIARLINSESELRPLICYGYPQALVEACATCATLALTMGLSYREVRSPLADAAWPPGEMILALVDCSAPASELSIDRWSRWLSCCDTSSGSRTLALFSHTDALDACEKERAASLAFNSAVPCVFVSSAPTLCDLFSALRSALSPRSLARVNFTAPEGSEAWSELWRLGAALDAVENRWASPLQTHAHYRASPQPDTESASFRPTRRLAAFFERMGFGY